MMGTKNLELDLIDFTLLSSGVEVGVSKDGGFVSVDLTLEEIRRLHNWLSEVLTILGDNS